jgi:double-stranded uracil-DNA glycosylase
MGAEIETLDDLLRPHLHVLCIGVNPAPTSVQAGHYYQGRAGQRFLRRLRTVGLLPAYDGRWEDDVAYELAIGQTDVVKRPTSKADKVGAEEFAYGRQRLHQRLAEVRTELVIFTFKAAAQRVFDAVPGHGFIPGLTLAGGEVYVMPGPYEKRDITKAALDELARLARPAGLVRVGAQTGATRPVQP